MITGIFNEIIPGLREEVKQESIDFWCNLCQFPIGERKCQTKEQIQQCWNRVGSVTHVWHILHECPFNHLGQKCRCNDFKTIQEAFNSAGLTYKE